MKHLYRVYGSLDIFIFFIAVSASYLGKYSASDIMLSILFVLIMLEVYSLIIFFPRLLNIKILMQLLTLGIIFTFFWEIPVFTGKVSDMNQLTYIVGLIATHLSLIGLIIYMIKTKKQYWDIKKINITPNVYLIVSLLFLIMVNIENIFCLYKGDSLTYFSSFIRNIPQWDYSFNSLKAFEIAGHKSYAYILFIYLFSSVLSIGEKCVQVSNIILMLLTVLCVYFILKKVFPRLTKKTISWLTLAFGVMPLYGGILYAFHTDFPLCSFFIILVFCYLYELKIFQIAMYFALCFSKETGIIICAFFVFGDFMIKVINIFKTEQYLFLTKLKNCFYNLPYIEGFILLIGGASIVLSDSGWGKVGKAVLGQSSNLEKESSKIIVDFQYIFYKMQQLFITHFFWIVTLLFILTVIYIVILMKSKNKGSISEIKMFFRGKALPIFLGYAAFLIVNFFYLTYMHYRYIQLQSFFIIILLAFCISVLFKRDKLKEYVVLGVAILFFAEVYFTVDPITLKALPNVPTGKSQTVSMRRIADVGKFVLGTEKQLRYQFLNEGLIFSRQQIGIEYAMEQCLDDIDYKDGDLIVLTKMSGIFTARCILGSDTYDNYFWNSNSKQITYGTGQVAIQICYDDELSDETAKKYQNIYYLIMPYSSHYNVFANISEDELTILKNFDSRGWRIKLAKMQKK